MKKRDERTEENGHRHEDDRYNKGDREVSKKEKLTRADEMFYDVWNKIYEENKRKH